MNAFFVVPVGVVVVVVSVSLFLSWYTQLVVESTKLKAVEDVPLLPLVGPFFEDKVFPTGEVAKRVREMCVGGGSMNTVPVPPFLLFATPGVFLFV